MKHQPGATEGGEQDSSPERCFLAADVGGTNIRVAVIDSDGNIRKEERFQARLSDADISEEDVVNALAGALAGLIGDDENIKAVGIGFPGFFRGDSGIVAASPNIPALRDFGLAEAVSKRMNLPVAIQNDGLCAAIGEHRFGAGKGRSSLLHLTLGTGIGGGLILNHHPYTGDGGMAAEFGHLCVDTGSGARLCGCGNNGCVEAYASAAAVMQHYAEQTGRQMQACNIFTRACEGDAIARSVFEQAGRHLGQAVAEAIKLLDIYAVTVSGGLIGAWPLLHPALMTSLDAKLIPPLKGKVEVLRTTLGDRAGLLGAAVLNCP